MELGGNRNLKDVLDKFTDDGFPLTQIAMQNKYRTRVAKWYRDKLSYEATKNYFSSAFRTPMPGFPEATETLDGIELMSIPLLPDSHAYWVTAYAVNDYFWRGFNSLVERSHRLGERVIEISEESDYAIVPGKGEEPAAFDVSKSKQLGK